MNVSEAFIAICDLAMKRGATNICTLPGCWESAVDDQWWVALNGHDDERRCSKGARVPSFSAYVEFNGWPAGVIDPAGGIIAAGDCANEDAFIAAVRAAQGIDAPSGGETALAGSTEGESPVPERNAP